MDGDDIGRLIYLALLGAALLMWFIVENRQSPGRTVRQAAAWGFIFLGVIAVVGLWDDIRATVGTAPRVTVADGRIEAPRSLDGHYYLPMRVNGEPVTFMVDTGASRIVLNRRDAERVGIDTDRLAFVGRAATANGVARTAPVRLESLTLGPIADRDVRASVIEGDLGQSLLGMDYLRRFSNIQVADGRLILSR